jgi:hypothetical protein
LEALAQDLKDRGGLDLSECFIDGAFVVAKRGGCVGATKRGKSTKLMAMADRFGLPLAACAASASPHEVRLVAATLDSRFVDALPCRLIGDRAYDADPLDAALAQLGIEMIAPHRRGRTKPKTQDGCPLHQ